MAKRQRGGLSYKNQYSAYKSESRWNKNKVKKLEKHILTNDNDKEAIKALDRIRTKTYTKGKPGIKGWGHTQEQELLKQCKSDDDTIRIIAKEKLAKLKVIMKDIRPSPLRKVKIPAAKQSIADQLFNIGLINEKRRNFINSRLGSIRKR
jgi:hypothetical protein